MNLQGCLDLLRCHLLSFAIFAIDADAQTVHAALVHACHAGPASSGPGLSLAFAREADLLCELCVFLDLLLGVPEPLVDLILFQIELLAQLGDLLTRWSLTFQSLIQVPKSIFLALGLPCAVSLLRSSCGFFCFSLAGGTQLG